MIPSSVTSIGNCAFYGCSSLKQITIPSSVTSIGDHSLSNCSSLTQIEIPSKINVGSLDINSNTRIIRILEKKFNKASDCFLEYPW